MFYFNKERFRNSLFGFREKLLTLRINRYAYKKKIIFIQTISLFSLFVFHFYHQKIL